MSQTLAERFKQKAFELVPYQDSLQDIDSAIDSASIIDEIMFRRSEYLGGMAVVILELLERESRSS